MSAACSQAASLGDLAAAIIDEGVVQDGKQPAAQVAAGDGRSTPLVGADKGVVHEVLGLGLVAGQGSGVAPQGAEQTDHVLRLGSFMTGIRSCWRP